MTTKGARLCADAVIVHISTSTPAAPIRCRINPNARLSQEQSL
jgi:hypothetical protein